jgi:hypothetical protein
MSLARIGVAASALLLAAVASASGQRRGGGRDFSQFFGGGADANGFYQPPAFRGNTPYDGRFTFARIKYRGFRRMSQEGPGWSHDYPDAEENFSKILKDVTAIRPFIENGPMVGSVLVSMDDPLVFKYPVAYLSEPEGWQPEQREISGLRSYLMKGGFLIVDDFRENGREYGFSVLRQIVGAAIPEARWVQLTGKEPIFDSFFKIDLSLTVNGTSSYGGNRPTYWGIYENNDPKKRLMIIANVDNDVGESWEYSATGFVPIASANELYKLGINYVIYALTH